LKAKRMADERIRYFTLEEANRTLPYVGPIVADILAAYKRWRAGVRKYENLAAQKQGKEGESPELASMRGEVDDVAQQINAYLEELSTVGCVFKGFDEGLVDFYSKLDGRDVFLCWKLGESEISYWHELDAGFAGRQELAVELIQGEGC
jgi:hypothetical protein